MRHSMLCGEYQSGRVHTTLSSDPEIFYRDVNATGLESIQ
jgi:hypothetical protein